MGPPALIGHAVMVRPFVSPDDDRPAWLEARRKGLGGSDAAAVCGVDEWRSPFAVWCDKVGLDTTDDDNEPMLWGRLLEPVVRAEAARRAEQIILPFPRMIRHYEVAWALCDLDGIVDDPDRGLGVYEGKTANSFAYPEWADNSVPVKYLIQAHHAMFVTGFRWALIACLIGGQRFELRYVDRDDELVDNLIRAEGEFWSKVERMDPPPPDHSPQTARMLNRMWLPEPDSEVTVDEAGVRALLKTRATSRRLEKTAGARARLAENRIKWLMRGSTVAVGDESGERLCTWKPDKNGTRRFRPQKGV